MREPQPKAIRLKDYSPPAFRIDSVDLDVDLRDDHARVRARLQVRRNGGSGALVLDGDELGLLSVQLNGQEPQYSVTPEKLTIENVPDAFTLETVILFGGMWLYLRSTTSSSATGKYGMVLLGFVMLPIQAAVFFGPPPVSDRAAALTALVFYAVFAWIISWLERKRAPLY